VIGKEISYNYCMTILGYGMNKNVLGYKQNKRTGRITA